MFKLVIHISDLDKWQTVINNINNSVKGLRDSYTIHVVANVNAIQGYLDPKIREQITAIDDPNIHFFACNNSLIGQNVTPEMLNPDSTPSKIGIVPVGIISIVEDQNNGFAYLKP